MKDEIWKDIYGYERYYKISNYGRVKSLVRDIYRRNGIFSRHKPENIKSPVKNADGYLSVKLCKDGKNKTICIHILVANAFLEKPNSICALEVNHIDTNRENNCVENLEWCTHKENILHSSALGHYKNKCGEKNPNYKNNKLHFVYKANPQLAIEKLSRKGKQNGRCKAVTLYSKENIKIREFDYIRECADWLLKELNLNLAVSTIHQHILKCNRDNSDYHGYKFEI